MQSQACSWVGVVRFRESSALGTLTHTGAAIGVLVRGRKTRHGWPVAVMWAPGLAAARGEQHPAEALAVYWRHLEAALQPADNGAYDQVVRLLERMRPLSLALGGDDDFDALVAESARPTNGAPT